jgi:hypothetical protein
MNPQSYTYMICDKGAKNMQWKKKSSLFNNCCWENWISPGIKQKLDSCLSLCICTDPKWIKDLLVQERVGDTLELIDIGNNFLNRTPVIQQLRQKVDKLDYMKPKSFCSRKEIVIRLKKQPIE